LDKQGEVQERGVVATSKEAVRDRFAQFGKSRVVMENGTHSRWVSRLLKELGHEVIVANTYKVRLICENNRKHDKIDAEYLARLGRVDPKLLFPIQYRGEQAQAVRCILKARDGLVRARSQMICQVRGMVKAFGSRMPASSAESFVGKSRGVLPKVLEPALEPLLETIEMLTTQIRKYDTKIGQLGEREYPETALLRQVSGVGPITSLAYVVTLEDPKRFSRSRQVGPFVGLVPKLDQSGAQDKQLSITRAGDNYLRKLLINSAQYILGHFGPDCDLRRHGMKIAQRGGKNAKKRAVVAVARKLCVLLHHLWVGGEVYDPMYNSNRQEDAKASLTGKGAVAHRGGARQVPAGLLHVVSPLRVTDTPAVGSK
jgi:transposase